MLKSVVLRKNHLTCKTSSQNIVNPSKHFIVMVLKLFHNNVYIFLLRVDSEYNLTDKQDKQIILTAAHCIAHNDNGYVKKVDLVRIRVPKLDLWDKRPNRARHNQKDERFYNFIVKSDQLHIYPNYKDAGNPNTGDDLGLIQLTDKEVIKKLNLNCKFWDLPYDRSFKMDRHLGTCISFL